MSSIGTQEGMKRIAVLAGDGIGPEVMAVARAVLERVATLYHREIAFLEAPIGGAAFNLYGSHCPEETLAVCREADAILFGSVGGPITEAHLPKWKGCEANSILALRKAFQLAANFRPAKVYTELPGSCPLRDEIISNGVDLVIIRELQGDIYFGEHTFWRDGEKRRARDVAEYTEEQIALVARVGFDAARKRRSHLTSVDKANVLHTSKLWREVVHEVHREYPDVTLVDMLVDNCALQLVKSPSDFDVIVTSNLFGDILSDLAAALPGSLGLTPSASLNEAGFGLYEPSGGTAPDIAGQGIANPIAQVLSAAMLLRFSFGWQAEAACIEGAVSAALQAGLRTADIYVNSGVRVSTSEMGAGILERLHR